MYFSMNPQALSARIDSIRQVIDDKNKTAPLYLVTDQVDQKLTLKASGQQATVTINVPAKVSVSGDVIVNLDMLLMIVRTYSGGNVFIKANIGNTMLCLSDQATFPKNSTVEIPLLPSTVAITAFVPGGTANSIDISPSEFSYAIQHVTALIKEDKNNPLTGAVLLKFEKDKLDMAMMSSRGFTIVQLKCEASNPGSMLIPISVLQKLPQTSSAKLHIEDCGNTAVFNEEGWNIVSCTYSGNFPDYNAMLSAAPSAKLSFITKDVLPVLRRADILADQQGVKSVVFEVIGNELHVSQNSKKGQMNNTILCQPDNISAPIGFTIDDIQSSVLSVGSETTELSWVGNAVCVTPGIMNDLNIRCIIQTVKVHTTPTAVQQVQVADPADDSQLIAAVEPPVVTDSKDLMEDLYEEDQEPFEPIADGGEEIAGQIASSGDTGECGSVQEGNTEARTGEQGESTEQNSETETTTGCTSI